MRNSIKTPPSATGVLHTAIRAATRKLPFKSARQQNEMLQYVAGDLAEAYRIGAEEAQEEISRRLATILISVGERERGAASQ